MLFSTLLKIHKELGQCLNHRSAGITFLIPFLMQGAFYKVAFHY